VNKIKTKILIPTLGLATAIGLGTLGVRAVKADETSSYPPFVQKLVEKFNLNEDEVKTFFEEERQEHQQAMEQNREEKQQNQEERLNQAVEDGVITEEQKEALQNKQEEMRQEQEQERKQHQEEMQAWFEEQGIDPETLAPYGGFGHHRGFGPPPGEPPAQ
jgi:hypothetical protein